MGFRSRCVAYAALILTSFLPGFAWSQEAPGPSGDPPPEATGPPRRDAAVLWWIALGNYDADENAGQLDDERGQFAFTTGAGYRFRPALTIGFEFAAHTADFDAPAALPPFGGSIGDEYDLNADGLVLSLTVESPWGPVRPFVGAGLGIYKVTLNRYGSLFGFPGTVVEEKEIEPGLNLSVGLAFVLTPKVNLTFEYRRLLLEAGFGALTSGDVAVGGAMVLGGFRYVTRI